MNLNQFLKQVDSLTEKMPKEKLAQAIYGIASNWPEHRRQDFLEYLEESHTSPDGTKEKMRKDLADIEKQLDQIEAGELCLGSQMNEEYDDWYNSAAEEFYFFDPDHVTDALETAFDLAHSLMDCEMYEEAYRLCERLLKVQAHVEGDYGDYVDIYMDWKELEAENLISLPKDRFIREMLYAAYQVLPVQERIPALFWIMKEGQGDKASLETVLQAGGGRLPHLEEFLEKWTEYLGEQEGELAGSLLKEALEFQDDPAKTLQAAGRFAVSHPELYEDILRKGKSGGRDDEMLQIGLQAIQDIPEDYIARSRIALLTAEYALRLGNQEKVESCWLEAFRSAPNLVNFLRLMTESRDFELYRKAAKKIYLGCWKKADPGPISLADYDRPGKRRLDPNTYYALEFFNGNFDEVLNRGMKAPGALGWSSTFMKEGIALFLLSLYQGDGLPAGCWSMCKNITSNFSFDSEKYSEGLVRKAALDSGQQFMECLNHWKQSQVFSSDEQNKIIKKLEKWIEGRIEGIMEANRRNYYWECAAFIAALGEVKESIGQQNGKAQLLEAYGNAYPRRRAFQEELRRFGMRDMRKSALRKLKN